MRSCEHNQSVGIKAAIMAVVAALPCGCYSGSLASSTGPRRPQWEWSMANRQMVHVGEEVEFQFVLVDVLRHFVHPMGLADYCVTLIGDERMETTPDVHGYFRFSYPFAEFQPGQKIKVTTKAYRQRGGRDFMKIRGHWLQSDSPYEIRDKKVAADSIVFTVYESLIEFTVVRPPDDLDPETGVIRIRRADGTTKSVYVDKPGRPGFVMSDPGPDGFHHVTYRPRGTELNPTGTTDVTLTIYDRSGQAHHAALTVETP